MEKLEYALQILFLGFSVVLFTLFFLYGVISLFNRIFYHPAKKQSIGPTATADHLIERKPASSELTTPVIAAVTAAVFRYLHLQGAVPDRVAISLQTAESGTQSSWAADGRKKFLERSLEHERLRRKGLYEKI